MSQDNYKFGEDQASANPAPAAHPKSKLELDDEIEAMEQRSRRHRNEVVAAPDLPAMPVGKLLAVTAVLLVLLVAAGGITLAVRSSQNRALAKETTLNAIPTVAVVYATPGKADEELALPGTLQANVESPIYARTNGYLVRWYKDIGAKVKKGELLAHIDTPEVDQELNQARAARQQIAAQVDLARISTDRWQNLRKSDSVSAQEADQQASAYKQAQANLAAADANVRRLEQLESFKNVYAPFAGVLTKRNVDTGALINAGSSGAAMFTLAQVDVVRVFVNVPQVYAPSIKVGLKAALTIQEYPAQKFEGTVGRTAEAIDPATRTLLTEVDVPNKDGRLLPGSFGQVHFNVGSNVPRLVVPVNTMLFRSEGPRVGVVGPDGKVQLKPITIGRDYGATLEILGGISAGDPIIINPSDSLQDGQPVNLAKPQAPASQGGVPQKGKAL